MKAILFAAFAGLIAPGAQAVVPQLTPVQSKEVVAICSTTACRTGGYDVVVRYDAEHYQTVPVTPSPYVTPDGKILIFPGETIAVQFTVTGDAVSAPKFLRQYATSRPFAMQVEADGTQVLNPNDGSLPPAPASNDALPANTLLITYGQPAGETGMRMVLSSNMKSTLKLDAELSLIRTGGYDWQYTSTCPIQQTSYEEWPGGQGPMLLSNFRFLPKTDKMMCD